MAEGSDHAGMTLDARRHILEWCGGAAPFSGSVQIARRAGSHCQAGHASLAPVAAERTMICSKELDVLHMNIIIQQSWSTTTMLPWDLPLWRQSVVEDRCPLLSRGSLIFVPCSSGAVACVASRP